MQWPAFCFIIDSIQFVQSLQNQFKPIGQSLRFSCRVRGMPTPTITWLKNGAPLSKNNRLVIDRSLLPDNVLSSDLLLYTVSQKDEGLYQCLAKNSFEEKATAAARLVIGGEKWPDE